MLISASNVQRQFWLAQKLQPETTSYNYASVLRVEGRIDLRVLRRAFEGVVERHTTLRTVFVERDGALLQDVRDHLPLEWKEYPICVHWDGNEVRKEIARPYDLENGPLMRVSVFGKDDEVLIVWMKHHLIFDVTSLWLLERDICELYAAGIEGRSASLPETRQYEDFCRAEEAWLCSQAADEAKNYFAGLDLNSIPPLSITTIRGRPKLQPHRGQLIRFELAPDVGPGVDPFSKAVESKSFHVLLSAYLIALSKFSGERRLCVGIPFANRQEEGRQNLAGCCVNTLPLPIDLNEGLCVTELLNRIRQLMLSLRPTQGLPLNELIAAVKPPRDASRTPIYQAGFTFYKPIEFPLHGTKVTSYKAHAGGAQMDLFMTLWKESESYLGILEYAEELYDPRLMKRFVDCYVELARSITSLSKAELETAQVSKLKLLPAAEEEIVLRAFNKTQVEYGEPNTLGEMFYRQVKRTPNAVALRYGDDSWSYSELFNCAKHLAFLLRESGVEPGMRVALFFERSIEMVLGMYATILAGAVYVPIDPQYPPARIQHMLDMAKPSCVLLHNLTAERWPSDSLQRFDLEPNKSTDENTAFELSVVSRDPAYVIFTSGSTGLPKGAENTHGGIVNRLRWMQQAFPLSTDDVVLQKTPYSFDVSVWEFFWPLQVGAVLEIAAPGVHQDPRALAQLVRSRTVTTIHFVPSMLALFLDEPTSARCDSLRRVICSGEALSTELVRRFCELLPCELYNLYGPTEAAVDVTWWDCRIDPERKPVPIGKPIANTQIYILDQHQTPVPIGVSGELYIGGVQVATGYVGQPEQTRQRFIPDPFTPAPGSRLYRTGDRAIWNEDGTIGYLGRLDNQVKIRGLRIELGEIEEVLLKMGGVSQAVVIPIERPSGDAVLSAYVVRDRGNCDDDQRALLDAKLREQLPTYMVPQHLTFLDSIPLNANGKVDRRALPPPFQKEDQIKTAALPRNEIERWLVEQWKEILGIDVISITTSFFEQGGTSLTAAKLLARIRKRFFEEFELVRLFEFPTVETLAACITKLSHSPKTRASNGPGHLSEARKRARARREALSRRK